MCFQGLENLVEHHFEGSWKTEAWQIFFVAMGGHRWPCWSWMVLLCPMLDATIGGFREGRNALQMFWLIHFLFDSVWLVSICGNIFIFEFLEGVGLGSISLSRSQETVFVNENLWQHPLSRIEEKMQVHDHQRKLHSWSVLFYVPF